MGFLATKPMLPENRRLTIIRRQCARVGCTSPMGESLVLMWAVHLAYERRRPKLKGIVVSKKDKGSTYQLLVGGLKNDKSTEDEHAITLIPQAELLIRCLDTRRLQNECQSSRGSVPGPDECSGK